MIQRKMNRTPPDLSAALAVDARLTEIERELNLLLNVTPTNGAEAWTDFQRSGFESVPTLQSRPLGFDPNLLKRDLSTPRSSECRIRRSTRSSERSMTRADHAARGSGHVALQVRHEWSSSRIAPDIPASP